MPFRLRRDTRKWFADIEDDFALDFDMYYFCLMAGLRTDRKEKVLTADTTELVDRFPDAYKAKGRLLTSVFLSKELEQQGIDLSERDAVHAAIAQLIDTDRPAKLSELGMNEMNKYSYGGFDILTEWLDDRPRSIETFLPLYVKHLNDADRNAD